MNNHADFYPMQNLKHNPSLPPCLQKEEFFKPRDGTVPLKCRKRKRMNTSNIRTLERHLLEIVEEGQNGPPGRRKKQNRVDLPREVSQWEPKQSRSLGPPSPQLRHKEGSKQTSINSGHFKRENKLQVCAFTGSCYLLSHLTPFPSLLRQTDKSFSAYAEMC